MEAKETMSVASVHFHVEWATGRMKTKLYFSKSLQNEHSIERLICFVKRLKFLLSYVLDFIHLFHLQDT